MWISCCLRTLPCLVLALSGSVIANSLSNDGATNAVKSPTKLVDVHQIVQKMNAEKLAGQMIQLELALFVDEDLQVDVEATTAFAKQNVGAVFNGLGKIVDKKFNINVTQWRSIITQIQKIFIKEKAEPLLFSLDSIHGAGFIHNAVILPHQINMGATFNTRLVYEAGKVAAEETLAAGISQIFSPNVDLAVEKSWSRLFETFSECPYVVSEMATAIVQGLQSTQHTSACLKHFIAYSLNKNGFDRADVEVSAFNLKNYYAAPYESAIKAGVNCVMASYATVNRVPILGSSLYLDDILRKNLKFDKVVFSNDQEVDNIQYSHLMAASQQEAVERALQTSFDVNMAAGDTNFLNFSRRALSKNTITIERLRSSVERIIDLKARLGLYDNPVPGEEYLATFRSKEHVQTAVDVGRESIVLLKNQNNILPLDIETNVFLTGAGAHDVGLQCGSWTVEWQGESGDNSLFPNGISFKDGLSAIGKNVNTFPGVKVDGTYNPADLEKAKKMAAASDVIVMTLAEATGTEIVADVYDMTFEQGQLDFAEELLKTGKPMILVLVISRPRLLKGLADKAAAVLNTMRLGEMGGQPLAEILYGKVSPSGKSPYKYPKYQSTSGLSYYEPLDMLCINYSDCETEFDFGVGLSYTTFTYGKITLSSEKISRTDTLKVSFTITNTGKMAGMETAMLFLRQQFRRIATPEVQMLKGFQKVFLKPGESTLVTFVIKQDAWTVYGPELFTDFEKRFEPATFFIALNESTSCGVYADNPKKNPLCAKFTVS